MIKKKWPLLLVLGLMFVFGLGLSGCEKEPDDDPDDDDPIITPPTLSLAAAVFTLEFGGTATIVPIIGNTTEVLEVAYAIADPTVISITGNVIAALKTGTTAVTASLVGHPEITVAMSVTVKTFPLALSGESEVYVDETITLSAFDRNNPQSAVVFWESNDIGIATVNQNGVVTGVSEGVVQIKISSFLTNHTLEKEITVLVPDATGIELNAQTAGPFKTFSQTELEAHVFPSGADQEVVWSSENEEIATVDATGKVTLLRSGTVIINATAKTNSLIKGTISITVEVDPIALLRSLNVDNPIVQYVTTYGNTQLQQWVYGSVSKYYPGALNLKVNLIPVGTNLIAKFGYPAGPNPYKGSYFSPAIRAIIDERVTRSGLLKTSISNIIYHDTGNNSSGATAAMHATYLAGQDNLNYRARSWHYTVDDKEVIQHLPDNEVAWQGDTDAAYGTTIGIETCVNAGSDLYLTWHRTAKLMAGLLVKYNLKVSAVKQHYDYSQKDCPRTLRHSNLYGNAIDLITAEYLVLTELSGYTIAFTSNNPEYINDLGRIVDLPAVATRVSYTVRITNGSGYDAQVILYSTLPGKTA
ncbi:MAG TPA: hypothetical protein DD618_04440 [Acholeplasmatales bacterium]|nr:hypothetical protein [Acholeplasmatales bacterium]